MRESNIKRVKNYLKRNTRGGYFITHSKNARARTRGKFRSDQNRRYAESGAFAAECVNVLHGSMANHFGFFAKVIYRNYEAREIILDKAYEYASCQRQGEIESALGAFISWLDKSYPKPEGGVR